MSNLGKMSKKLKKITKPPLMRFELEAPAQESSILPTRLLDLMLKQMETNKTQWS